MAKKRQQPRPFSESLGELRRQRRKTRKVLGRVNALADEMGLNPIALCHEAILRGEDGWEILEALYALEAQELEDARGNA